MGVLFSSDFVGRVKLTLLVWLLHIPSPLSAWSWPPDQIPSPPRGSEATTDRPQDFLGAKACAECHLSEFATQSKTPMARAAESVAECGVLRQHPLLRFQLGPYAYTIIRHGNRSIYSVSDGETTVTVPILWAFGLGEAGQTYIFEWQGSLYQSYVSFFNDIQNLDLTLGAPRSTPPSLQYALGEPISPAEAPLCFGCHTTGAVRGNRVETANLIPGVTCEACHGPGARHVAAVKAGNSQEKLISNPATLSTGDLADFCGKCHRTWLQVALQKIRGVQNVRFQPYRMQNSRCWDPGDSRINCLACHDPHREIVRTPSFYDSKCLSCHVSRDQATAGQPRAHAACPVETRNCVTCHMPKFELPGGHFKFTDHWIRISRAREPYPD